MGPGRQEAGSAAAEEGKSKRRPESNRNAGLQAVRTLDAGQHAGLGVPEVTLQEPNGLLVASMTSSAMRTGSESDGTKLYHEARQSGQRPKNHQHGPPSKRSLSIPGAMLRPAFQGHPHRIPCKRARSHAVPPPPVARYRRALRRPPRGSLARGRAQRREAARETVRAWRHSTRTQHSASRQ